MRVLDLGCGTGFWGRLLAEGIERVSLVGVDRDRSLLPIARRLASRALHSRTSYVAGDAEALDLPDGYAHIVTCHRLLGVARSPERIVREMVRVCRPGGRILTVEPLAAGFMFWDPDPILTRLYMRSNDAELRGTRALGLDDGSIGLRVAEMLWQEGIVDLRFEGLLAPIGPVAFDSRLGRRELRRYWAWALDDANHPQVFRAQRLGGWSLDRQKRLARRYADSLAKRLASRARMREPGLIRLMPRVLLRGEAPRPSRRAS